MTKADGAGPTPEEFAGALLKLFGDEARVWVLRSRSSEPADWTGNTCRPSQLDDLAEDKNYWVSVAAYPKGAKNRQIQNMLGVAAVVIDDPTTKGDAAKLFKSLGRPTARIQTSRGSYHWWYFLKEPATAAQVRGILDAIAKMGLGDKSGNAANRYARLPCGWNNKPEHGNPSSSFSAEPFHRSGRIAPRCRINGCRTYHSPSRFQIAPRKL